ncbi:DUF1292 domain-containing protein [Chengkuizengella axinellae]|uniref:DUF1292 domain-containing protein n=1 Tax=Chengkuizengella axinellae TaxID=3064388 RepID=A0ABT9IVB3_9BACL|nr:DUF1292 domain-containing protein [Chengkuizengella sp. 2205SS18-9]MDP5273290.1 DUF1292 domain-containing protein [Chengkuizengella sp. 2205SS18-9]
MTEELNQQEEEQSFIITDDQGIEYEMQVVYTFSVVDDQYAVLIDKNNPEGDGVIFKLVEEDGEGYLEPIESDEEWKRVVAIYEEIVAEENNKA